MEMGDNTMLWKGTELKNSSCSKESDKSLGELSVADPKALMDYLSEMMDLCRENMAFGIDMLCTKKGSRRFMKNGRRDW